eukprot:COSAG01_NODE_35191_length_535_cov_2.263761_2_plen_85_part_01
MKAGAGKWYATSLFTTSIVPLQSEYAIVDATERCVLVQDAHSSFGEDAFPSPLALGVTTITAAARRGGGARARGVAAAGRLRHF